MQFFFCSCFLLSLIDEINKEKFKSQSGARRKNITFNTHFRLKIQKKNQREKKKEEAEEVIMIVVIL